MADAITELTVEAFKAGTWTDASGRTRTWTEAELDEIVAKYNTQDADHPWQAPVVLGHPLDNSPAYGWVESLERIGDTIHAKLVQLHDGFVTMLQNGSFKNRSISLYPDMLLQHIGFLGAVPPAVDGLAPVAFNSNDGASVMEFALAMPAASVAPEQSEPLGVGVDQAALVTLKAAQDAQAARSAVYGIRVLSSNSNIVKPAPFTDLTDEQFGDPVNYRFPLATSPLLRASLKVWCNWDNDYNETEKVAIMARMYAAGEQLGFSKDDIHFYAQAASGQPSQSTFVSQFAEGPMNPTMQAFVEWIRTTYNEETANQTAAKVAELEAAMSEQLVTWATETFGSEVGAAAQNKLTELSSAQGTPETPAAGVEASEAAAGTPAPAAAGTPAPAYSGANKQLLLRVEQLERDKRTEQHSNFCDSLVREGRITPAQKPLIVQQLENAFASDKAGVTVGAFDAQRKLYGELPKSVAFGEFANGERVGQFSKAGKGKFANNANVDPESLKKYEKVQSHAEKNGLTYAQALKQLTKEGAI